jgi:hypothetical protein
MLILTRSRRELESDLIASLVKLARRGSDSSLHNGLRLVLNSASRLEPFEAVNESRSNAVLYQLWT